MSIDWTQQPGPEYVALVLKGGVGDGRLFWVTTSDNGDYYQEDADKGVSGWSVYREGKDGHFTIHHKPTTTPYQPEVGEWCVYKFEEENDNAWRKCFFIGTSQDGRVVFETKGGMITRSDATEFRAEKTERELLVDIILGVGNMSEG